MRELWLDWPRMRNRIADRRRRLFLLDFDGTLVAIVKKPHQVSLSSSVRRSLIRLSRQGLNQVVIISGRTLQNVRSLIGLKGLTYVGNHGLEMQAVGLPLPAPLRRLRKQRRWIRRLARDLGTAFSRMPGVFVEDKDLTLSVHFRNLPKNCSRSFHSRFRIFKGDHEDYPVVWRKGKKVWEIRPDLAWGKGEAARYLWKKFPRSLPIVIGDDRTDEDMFKAMKRVGITIRVGSSRKTEAEYFLRTQKDVVLFLERLCQSLK